MFPVKEWAQEMMGYENIIFYGTTSHVGGMLSAIDIYIMPSRFEGFPVSAVEAQVNGLLCVLSDYITDEVKMSEKCNFWSIDNGAEEWAKKLSVYNAELETKVRKKGYQIAIDGGFDIAETAKKMFQLYTTSNYKEII